MREVPGSSPERVYAFENSSVERHVIKKKRPGFQRRKEKKARAKKLSAERRREIARKAVQERWKRHREKVEA